MVILFILSRMGDEAFFMDQLEKSVKIRLTDKKRKEIILNEIKISKKDIVAFNKSRKKHLKEFIKINNSRETELREFKDLFDKGLKERRDFQKTFIYQRKNILDHILDEEWKYLRADIDEELENEFEKAKKKGKSVYKFKQTQKEIEKIDPIKGDLISKKLEQIVHYFKEIEFKFDNEFGKDKDIFLNKNNEEELLSFSEEVNTLREELSIQLTDFHRTVKENTSISEWKKIMKNFNKEVVITSH